MATAHQICVFTAFSLYEAFERFEADENAYVAILTGSGGNAFCTGMDLKEAAPNALGDPPRGCLPIIGDGLTVTTPTIAAVNGGACAGGWLFAQMCDLCLAALPRMPAMCA